MPTGEVWACFQEEALKVCSALPDILAISERGLPNLPIHKIDPATTIAIAACQTASELPDRVKSVVEIEIEKGEAEALKHLNTIMNEEQSKAIRGGVLLLGSLAWECPAKQEKSGNGKLREDWRLSRLNKPKKVSGLPLRYGRISQGRRDQYTMCFNKDETPGQGSALFSEFKAHFPTASGELTRPFIMNLETEIEELAKAEMIWKGKNVSSFAGWGFVGMWINPKSLQKTNIEDFWLKKYGTEAKNRKLNLAQRFGSNITSDEGLIQIEWPKEDLQDIDFCLCTPTEPSPGAWSAAAVAAAIIKAQRSVQKIDDQVISSGIYFEETYGLGIRTSDDDAIEWEMPPLETINSIALAGRASISPG